MWVSVPYVRQELKVDDSISPRLMWIGWQCPGDRFSIMLCQLLAIESCKVRLATKQLPWDDISRSASQFESSAIQCEFSLPWDEVARFQVYVPQVIRYKMAENILSTGTILLKARKKALLSACRAVSNSQFLNSIKEPIAEMTSGTK